MSSTAAPDANGDGEVNKDVIQTEKRHSSDIIATAEEMRNGGIAATVKKDEGKSSGGGGGCFGNKPTAEEKERQLQEKKRELDMDEHEKGIEEMIQRYGLDIHNALPLQWEENEEGKQEWRVDINGIKGLSTSQVEDAREQFGWNQLTPPEKRPEWIVILDALFNDFFAMLLWGGSVLCFIAYGIKLERDNLYLGIVLAFVVTFTGIFGYLQEKKSSELMESFAKMMPEETLVIRCDETGLAGTKLVNALELVPGDIIKIKYGDKIPADVRVIECSDNFNVDNSSLTGESEPQRRSTICTDENPLETQNLCFFGTECPEGQAHGMVVRTGDNTVMGRIASLTSSLEDDEVSPIKKEVNMFVFLISMIAIFLGVSFFFIGLARGTEMMQNLVFMIGIIVANVPEGLILTVLVCLSLTAQRMFTSNVLVKDLEGVETLGSTTCICSDKTGTLTQNIMTVQKVCYDNETYTAMNTAFGAATINLQSGTFNPFLRCAIVCNTAEFDENSKFQSKKENGKKVPDRSKPIDFEKVVEVGGQTESRVQWKTNGDATESALIKFGQKFVDVSEYRADYKEVAKIPFNSKNKFMVVISDYPQDKLREGEDAAFLLTMKGAPERVINRCSHVMIDGEEREMTPEYLAQIESLQTQCSKQGLRVLGFAEKPLDRDNYPADYRFVTENPNFPMGADLSASANKVVAPDPRSAEQLTFLGLYALIDPPRPQVRPAVAKCKTAGIRVIMVTGDHPITAKAIARQVGIIWGDAARGGDAHGPATQEDYEEWNAQRGLTSENRINEDGEVYFDPRLAPAIVVPGWEILPDDCHMGNAEPTKDPKTDVTCVPKEKWDDILGHTQIVFARTSPQQKLIIVENCKQRGEIVAVTGDGVNDAPALRKAHIGVAMGIMGSDVSKNAADMILLDDNFASIVQGVEEGRLIFDNLKKSIAYTLSSNIPEIAPFLCFITLNIPLPLSTVLILFVDLGTDMIPAISMAWENAESDIMRRPPRNSDTDHLVTKKLIFFAYLQIGVIQALAGFFTYIVVLGDYGFPAEILQNTGFDWGLQTMWCKTKGGRFVNQDFDPNYFSEHEPTSSSKSTKDWDSQHPIWYKGDDGEIEECAFAAKDVRGNAMWFDQAHEGNTECRELYAEARDGNTEALNVVGSADWFWAWELDYPERPSVQDCWDSAKPLSYYNKEKLLWTSNKWVSSLQAKEFLYEKGFRPFIPFKSRTSVFYSNQWLMADLYGSEYGSNQQYVPGFGMPIFRIKYAQYLEDSGEDALEKFNVNLNWPFGWGGPAPWWFGGPVPVEPVIFFAHQSVGTYDIKDYGEKVGDVYFPTKEISVAQDIAGNDVPMYDPVFDTPLNQIDSNPRAAELMVEDCKDAPNNPDLDCERITHKGFGNATFSFKPIDYNYRKGQIIPDFKTVADFSNLCKGTQGDQHGDALMAPTPVSLCDENESGIKANVLSRMVQREALAHAQTAYFVAIVIVQWADLMICKTRMNSISQQGMLNTFMNFGLIFETLLACFFCYIPTVNIGVGTRPIRFTHWLPAVPFSLWIFGYDELRKWIMRTTTKTKENTLTGQVERDAGWMERNTYY